MVTYFEKVISIGENSDSNVRKEKIEVDHWNFALNIKTFGTVEKNFVSKFMTFSAKTKGVFESFS